MVQKKVPSKHGIQANHVKSEKRLANLKMSSSQHQDGRSRGADMKKKMKKLRSIKLSDLEALQPSSLSRRCSSQPGKPPAPPHVSTTTASASPQKQQPLVRNTDGSPNYMKPTTSSHAKKELFPLSLRNTQSSSNFKNLPRRFSSDSKASCVSSKKSAKTLTRSCSLSLVRSLTKTTSFKASRACPKKSTRAALCADMSAPQRATCSSTLKDSKFPAYLMLDPGGTELEGTSVMKVCPYTHCSLNGHHHAALPPLKSFMSARRCLLKTQKSMSLEALSPRRLKGPSDTKKGSEIEQNDFDAKATNDEIGMDIFIEIYAKEREAKPTGADQMGKIDFAKEIEDGQDIQSTIEEGGTVAGEGGDKHVAPSITENLSNPKFGIDLKEDFKKSFDDVAVEVDTQGIFFHEQNAEEADERNQPRWSHEEISMGSYCSDDRHDGEQHMMDVEMDGSDSKATEMEWEEQRLCGFGREEYVDSYVFFEEDTDSKVVSLSESSHDVSVTWLDDILGSYYEDILAEETLQEANVEESKSFEEEHGVSFVLEGTSGTTEIQETRYPSNDLGCDQSFLTGVSFEYPTKAEDNDGENEKHVDDEPSCDVKVPDEETIDNNHCQKMSETCNVGDTSKEKHSSLENNDESSNEENQVHMFDMPEDGTMVVQEQELLEKDQGKANKFRNTSFMGGEEQNTSKNWKGAIRCKRPVEDDDEMRKFNPREPKFLHLVPELEPEKVDLRHQIMDERKNAEEWMLDCALRQVVTKLAPARKKKVALLVEAFETVMPIPKCEAHMRSNSTFPHARHIQACS